MSTATAAAAHPRDPEIARLLERTARTAERARALAGSLSDAQLRWSPPSGGWGVGTVLEHLVTTDPLYLERMRRALDRARAKAPPGEPRPWKASLVGRLMTKAVSPESPRKLPAPGVFKPGPNPRPGVLRAFLDARRTLATLLRDADGYDVSRIGLSSPVSVLVRLNLGDAFHVLVNHAERHLDQIERVTREAGFPRA